MREKLEIKNMNTTINTYMGEVYSIEELKNVSSLYKDISFGNLSMYYMENGINDEVGFKEAKKAKKYPYKHIPSLNIQSNVKNVNDDYKSSAIVSTILSMLKDDIFKNKEISLEIYRTYFRHTYTNERFLHLNSENLKYKIKFKFNEERFFNLYYEKLEENKIIQDIRKIYTAMNKNVSTEKPNNIIIGSCNENIYDYFEELLDPKNYEENKEIYGKELFSKSLNLYTSLDLKDKKSLKYDNLPFFDYEGEINQNYRSKLIEFGKVVKPYTNRDYEKKLELENTASSYAKYGDYPEARLIGAYIIPEKYDVKKLDEKNIFIKELDIKYENKRYYIKTKECFLLDGMEIISSYPNFEIDIDGEELFTKKFIASYDNFPLLSNENSLVFNIGEI